MPPNKNPIVIGDWVAANVIISPIFNNVAFTTGSTPIAKILASGAIIIEPKIMFKPSGSFFSKNGAIRAIV